MSDKSPKPVPNMSTQHGLAPDGKPWDINNDDHIAAWADQHGYGLEGLEGNESAKEDMRKSLFQDMQDYAEEQGKKYHNFDSIPLGSIFSIGGPRRSSAGLNINFSSLGGGGISGGGGGIGSRRSFGGGGGGKSLSVNELDTLKTKGLTDEDIGHLRDVANLNGGRLDQATLDKYRLQLQGKGNLSPEDFAQLGSEFRGSDSEALKKDARSMDALRAQSHLSRAERHKLLFSHNDPKQKVKDAREKRMPSLEAPF